MRENREERITLRFTLTEMQRMKRKMDSAGIRSRSAYLRKMALDGYIVNIDLTDVKELIRLLRICSNNLNQYAKVANSIGHVGVDDIKDLRKRLDELLRIAKAIMKRLADIM